jgi:hypothetical protein
MESNLVLEFRCKSEIWFSHSHPTPSNPGNTCQQLVAGNEESGMMLERAERGPKGKYCKQASTKLL